MTEQVRQGVMRAMGGNQLGAGKSRLPIAVRTSNRSSLPFRMVARRARSIASIMRGSNLLNTSSLSSLLASGGLICSVMACPMSRVRY
jgi:hypothetical protein